MVNTDEPDGLLSAGVFVAPDATECTIWSGLSGFALGSITAAGEFAWFSDSPERTARSDDFIVEGLGLCPGAREFWDQSLLTQSFSFEFDVEGSDEQIDGYDTTRVRVTTSDPNVVVADGSLWITDDRWPIHLRVEGTIIGGVWAVLGDPYTLGDDPELDQLWTDCEEGDLAACDTLFLESPYDSGYERFGATCGLRFAPATDTVCADDTPLPQDEPYTLGDDPTLDNLWQQCAAGDPTACDDLFDTSPVGSAYEMFGEDCGMLVYTDLEPCEEVLAAASAPTPFEVELLLSDINSPELEVRAPDGTILGEPAA